MEVMEVTVSAAGDTNWTVGLKGCGCGEAL